jgi:hypothetical protein
MSAPHSSEARERSPARELFTPLLDRGWSKTKRRKNLEQLATSDKATIVIERQTLRQMRDALKLWCPLNPQKWRSKWRLGMSALCQNRKSSFNFTSYLSALNSFKRERATSFTDSTANGRIL